MTWFVGVDVGASKVAAALVDVNSGVTAELTKLATRPERGGAVLLRDCVALAEKVAASGSVAGIGIGVCEVVGNSGAVTSSHSFDWRTLDIAAAFAHIGPALVESDVRAAARAEATFGAGRGIESFLYVNAGSGISSAFVIDQIPFPGARGNAILIGAGPLHIEELAGGTAIARATGKTPAEIEEANLSGAVSVTSVLDVAGRRLGEAIAFAVNLLDPVAVVLGGSVALGSRRYMAAVEQAVREHVCAGDTKQLPIVPAELGGLAGVVGAALAAAQQPVELKV